MNEKYSSLFQPIKIGGMTAKNRIFMMAMGIHTPKHVNDDGSYTRIGADYFIERAKGGVGGIVTGVVQVQSMFDKIKDSAGDVTGNEESFVANSKYLIDNMRKYDCRSILQLTAGMGRNKVPAIHYGEDIAPSAIPNVWNPSVIHRPLTTEEIEKYIHGFGEAARIAKMAGFDAVEIHAMHEGYLLDQFTIANMNHRTDRFGGSLENRLRFATEIVQEIKKKCGNNFPVLIRYSFRSYMKGYNDGALPEEEFKEFGRDMEESIKAGKILKDAGYDALDCDNGTYDSFWMPHPPVYAPNALNLNDAIEFKRHVDIPIILAGKMDLPELAASEIEKGHFDVLGLARPLLTDPQWANKVTNDDLEDIMPCIGCHNGCAARVVSHQDMSCALNPAVGSEKEYEIHPAVIKKHVIVVGGGIGGMEAARVSALRGHNVDLYEKSDILGGVFIPAAAHEFKERDKQLLMWYPLQLEKLGVKVHMNTEITKEMLNSMKADEIFIATGSTEKTLPVAGIDNKKVISAIECLMGYRTIGQNVVVIGGGLTGSEIAYDLAKKGKSVKIVEALDDIIKVKGIFPANSLMLKAYLKHYGVEIFTNALLSEVNDNGVEIKIDCKKEQLDADTVILAVGYNSNHSLYDQIKDQGNSVHLIGDAHIVSNLMGAVWNAYEIAMKI